MKEYLEFKDGKSEKFWEIDLAQDSCEIAVRYGKIGSTGTCNEKTFNTPGQARAYYDKQKNAKLKKGYVLTDRKVSTAVVVSASEAPPLAHYLCSPSEESQALGLELVKNLLDSDPEAIDVPALVLLAYVNIEYEQKDHSAIRKKALALLKQLPKAPKGFGGHYEMRYVRYLCENGTSAVISRMIELSMEDEYEDHCVQWSDTRLRALPMELANFPEILELAISEAYLTEFPQVVFELPKLKRISFYASKICALPSRIGELQQLERMAFERNLLSELPDEIGKLSKLIELDLYKNKLSELPESMAELGCLEGIRLDGNPMNAPGQVSALFEGFYKDQVDVQTRRVLINLIFARNERACELAEVATLIAALDAKQALVRSNALIALGMKLEAGYQARPLAAACKLAVIGKTGLTAREIASRLEEYGLDVGTSIKNDTTHVLLGEKLGKKVQAVLAFEGVLMGEAQLRHFLHGQETPLFLDDTQDTEDAQENISELLLSEDSENQSLALEMLKRTGVSPEIITPLFLLFRLASDKKLRDTAKTLLLQGASSGFSQVINKNQNFKTATEKAADKYMLELAPFCELDVTLLSKLYCQKRRLGLNYFFSHGSHEEIVGALTDMLDAQGVLALRYCFLRSLPEAMGDVQGITKLDLHGNELKVLPASLARLSRLTEIDASHNRLSDLPQGLSELLRLDISANRFKALPLGLSSCKKLAFLQIDGNSIGTVSNTLSALPLLKTLHFGWDTMQGLPAPLLELTQLETLSLTAKTLEPFPAEFSNMKNLKSLDIGSCGLQGVPQPVLALQGLRELGLAHNRLASLPDALADLTQLEKLNLTFSRFSGFPLVITQLPGLRELRMAWSGRFDLPQALAKLSHLELLEVGHDQQASAEAIMHASCVIR